MIRAGGPAALRGFRLQTTYALMRLLRGERDQQFRPEGQEDLDILDAAGQATEHVQVKAYGQPLTFAQLADQDRSGAGAQPPYFARALQRLNGGSARERLVSFGPLGPELSAAWAGEGTDRERVRRKFQERGYADGEIDLLFSRLTFEVIGEEVPDHIAQSILRAGMTAGDVELALHALSWWLLRQSEEGAIIPLTAFQDRLDQMGQHLVESAAGHRVWGYALRPLRTDPLRVQTADVLRQELYEGIGARLEHITANVDVRRDALLIQLGAAFDRHSLVVLHGASGQGKTALAYRFLHENVHASSTYELGRLTDLDQVQQVIHAVQGRLRAVETPLWLLVDVRPGDALWLDVVRGLAGLAGVSVLVTVREEDWGRASADFDLLAHAELPLVFSEAEARPLFASLVAQRPSNEFLDFDGAWRRFELRGPLLEFVYLVTHEGRSLRARLAAQVEALERLWEQDGAKLDFFHAVSLAAAFGARVKTLELAATCHLHPRAVRSVIATLENEHLLRVREDALVEGLHAVRSGILLELLSSPETPPLRAFGQVIGAVLENDLELFLLHALLHLPDEAVPTRLQTFTPGTWTGWAAVMRALIWQGVHAHLERTAAIVETGFDAFEYGFWMFVPIDLLNLRGLGLLPDAPDWADATFIPESMRQAAQRIAALNFPPHADFVAARQWWQMSRPPPQPPQTSADWLGLAELAFYIGAWHLPVARFEELDVQAVSGLPLRKAGQVYFGLHLVLTAGTLAPVQGVLLERFQSEASILSLEDDGVRITIHFETPEQRDPLGPLEQGDGDERKTLSARMQRLRLLRQIVPDRQRYASQGYGHRVALLPVNMDTTTGDIPRESLPPTWGTGWNRTFIRLAERRFLLPDWRAHADHQLQRRHASAQTLEAAAQALADMSQDRDGRLHRAATSLQGHPQLANQLKLPRTAVDPWGLALHTDDEGSNSLERLTRQFGASAHDPYFRAMRDYAASTENFMSQGASALTLSALFSRVRDRNQAARLRLQYHDELRSIHLSGVNLTDALERLPEMQRQFRQRFSSFFGPQELDELEAKETQSLQTLWDLWGQHARPPTGTPSVKSAGEIEAGLHKKLTRTLTALRRSGIHLEEHSTEQTFEGEPALWLRLELGHAADLYPHMEAAVRGLHQWVGGAQDQRQRSVLTQRWANAVVVPVREGRPWRGQVFAYSTLLLQDTPAREHWWRHVPKELSSDLSGQLGFQTHALEPSLPLEALTVAVGRYFQLTSRQRDLAQVLTVSAGVVRGDVFESLDQHICEAEALIQTLCEGVLGEQFPQLAEQALALIIEGAEVDWQELGLAHHFPVLPGEEDAAAANALVLLLLIQQEQLQHEERQIFGLRKRLPTPRPA